ncbi:ABC transporter ATP-binding protein [Corticibacter populi]|uniref:ABC transporter ATP-binding protein n=1 Tax=Corticibacter populi TaxID=1550736 RepID=A0A3M6R089_9BURK|nr:ABC transporter ATP-binding protein [Corticibacter populi]RMX08621.1 ABC transporter ATP-binding protein [Corticibacter populi]RZS35951.1 carbohydrate ABC transporter ATP-binding protein (CUT1 family) [Corticibacter populi]
MAQLTPFSPSSASSPQAARPHLVLQQLRRSYGHHTVVRDLNLQVARGQFLALLGPSGCGKTTTLRMIAGFEQPDGGSIQLDGRLLANATTSVPPEARGMGMVFQSYALWPHMSVADNVGYALRLRGMRGEDYRRAVNEALEQVELADKSEAMPQQLSGGQKQRVALARCIAAKPQLILLDEPLANLDRHLRRTMEAAFRQLHRHSGATFIYVTHDQGEAMALADEIAVMHAGQLVQRASPQKLYQTPRSTWLARFIGQGSVLRIEAPGNRRSSPPATSGLLQEPAVIHMALRHAHADSLKPQQHILVRPEHVSLQAATPVASATPDAQTAPEAAAPTDAALSGKVLDCVFKGERFEVEVLLQLATPQRLLGYASQHLIAGQAVRVSIRQAWCLLDEPAG